MTKFSDLKLDPKVMKAIAEAGYETPTPIQAGAIPPALEGRDVLGIAQTGTGKTASFTLPMITLLGRGRARARMPRSLVLCPTRELAAQVAENFDIYAKHTKLTKALLIGGVSFSEQDKLIDRGVDVLIATPGRLLDHFERGKLLLTGVQIMVVDEADRMLDMGFIPDIEKIFQLTPFTRQTLFFSATMASEIERITNTFLHDPERIEVARQATASETITQKLVEIAPSRKDRTTKQKRALLRALIESEGDKLTNAIIFCNRKTEVDIVAKSLKKHGHDAAPIHGDLDQSHRTRTLEGFRDGKLKLLVASDVAARGLDIPAVSHVFNFDLPSHAEDYVHRIGRTGRAGRKGTSISIATPSDEKFLSAIENLLKKSLPRADAPEGYLTDEEPKPSSRSESGSGRNGRREDERKPPVQNDPRKDKPRDSRRDDRRPRRGDDRGPAVVGMGEHVPQFMLAELRPAVLSATEDSSETPESDTLKSPPRRRRSRKPSVETEAVKTAEIQEEQVVAAQPEPAAEPPSPEAPSPEAEQAEKPKRSRSRKPRAAEKTETSEETVKPARTPTRKSPAKSSANSDINPEEKSAEDASASPLEEAPKPKRTRRKKADDAGTAEEEKPVEVKTDEGDEKPRPRRARRRKSETVESDGSAPTQSETESSSGN